MIFFFRAWIRMRSRNRSRQPVSWRVIRRTDSTLERQFTNHLAWLTAGHPESRFLCAPTRVHSLARIPACRSSRCQRRARTPLAACQPSMALTRYRETDSAIRVRPEWHCRFLHRDLRRRAIFHRRRPAASRGRDDFSRRIFVLMFLCRDTTNLAW